MEHASGLTVRDNQAEVTTAPMSPVLGDEIGRGES